jgi:hypothetical protein
MLNNNIPCSVKFDKVAKNPAGLSSFLAEKILTGDSKIL